MNSTEKYIESLIHRTNVNASRFGEELVSLARPRVSRALYLCPKCVNMSLDVDLLAGTDELKRLKAAISVSKEMAKVIKETEQTAPPTWLSDKDKISRLVKLNLRQKPILEQLKLCVRDRKAARSVG